MQVPKRSIHVLDPQLLGVHLESTTIESKSRQSLQHPQKPVDHDVWGAM